MKVLAHFALVAGLTAGVSLAVSPAAQQPPAKEKVAQPKAKAGSAEDKAEAAANAVERLTDAYKLMETAETYKLPEALVGAGRMFLILATELEGKGGEKVQALDVAPEIETEDGKPVPGAEAKAEKAESFKQLAEQAFDEALAMAKAQGKFKEIDALIGAVKASPRAEGDRGAIGGPKLIVRTIRPNQTHVYHIKFATALPGAIGFQASVPVRCTMSVGDYVHFNQVVRVGNYVWKPKGDKGPAKTYTVRIFNGRDVPAQYRLVTN